MKIKERNDFAFDVLIEAEHARNTYYIHVSFDKGVVCSISITRNWENVLIFDSENFGWQITPADKQTAHVFKETLKLLNLTMPERQEKGIA